MVRISPPPSQAGYPGVFIRERRDFPRTFLPESNEVSFDAGSLSRRAPLGKTIFTVTRSPSVFRRSL